MNHLTDNDDTYRDSIYLLVCHCAMKAAKETLDEKSFAEFRSNFQSKIFDEKDWMNFRTLSNMSKYLEECR